MPYGPIQEDGLPLRMGGPPGGCKYKPEYCERAEELLSEGKTKAQLAAEFNLGDVGTMDDWAKKYPDFAQALSRGLIKAEAVWTDKLEKMMTEREVQPQLVKMYFASRFGWHTDNTKNKNDNTHGFDKDFLDAISPTTGPPGGRK